MTTTTAALLAALEAPVDHALGADLLAGVTGHDIRARICFMTEATGEGLTEPAWDAAVAVVAATTEAESVAFDAGRDEYIAGLREGAL